MGYFHKANLANGKECIDDKECASGLCVHSELQIMSDSSALGTCSANLANGKECLYHKQCASGICDHSHRLESSSGRSTCSEKKKVNERCLTNRYCETESCVYGYCKEMFFEVVMNTRNSSNSTSTFNSRIVYACKH